MSTIKFIPKVCKTTISNWRTFNSMYVAFMMNDFRVLVCLGWKISVTSNNWQFRSIRKNPRAKIVSFVKVWRKCTDYIIFSKANNYFSRKFTWQTEFFILKDLAKTHQKYFFNIFPVFFAWPRATMSRSWLRKCRMVILGTVLYCWQNKQRVANPILSRLSYLLLTQQSSLFQRLLIARWNFNPKIYFNWLARMCDKF
jgi:hypothetical protein